MPSPRPIQLLSDPVARKIAAGEVIDRPASVLRELLDNAIDAGSTQILVSWSQGGLREIQVRDDGWGMSPQDLELCILPHATSKISRPEDLEALQTLGFRGEALPSIGACARLEILTRRVQDQEASLLRMDWGSSPRIQSSSANPGTTITVQDLFHTLPGRKRFLKSPGAESRMCKQILEEKALAFPSITFELRVEGKLQAHWPGTQPWERFIQVHGRSLEGNKLFTLEAQEEDWSLWGVGSLPGYVRKDRRMMSVFVNHRRIEEFSFLQAMSYAYHTVLPGGFFPYASVFLQVDPSLVDFNVHPAKKQARFRNHSDLHKGIVAAFRSQIQKLDPYHRPAVENHNLFLQDPPFPFTQEQQSPEKAIVPGSPFAFSTNAMLQNPLGELKSTQATQEIKKNPEQPSARDWRYLGQIMGLFLLVEKKQELWILDMHAAHEKILFDQFREKGPTQELLVPRRLELEEEKEQQLGESLDYWADKGVVLLPQEGGLYLVEIPARCVLMEKEIVEFLESELPSGEDWEVKLYANMACKAALKAGDYLEHFGAQELIEKVLQLEQPRCPHGRPLWVQFHREGLYKLFGRLV